MVWEVVDLSLHILGRIGNDFHHSLTQLASYDGVIL